METAERHALDLVLARLRRAFPDVPADEVEDDIEATYQLFGAARVRTYLPLLVEREVRDRLSARTLVRGR